MYFSLSGKTLKFSSQKAEDFVDVSSNDQLTNLVPCLIFQMQMSYSAKRDRFFFYLFYFILFIFLTHDNRNTFWFQRLPFTCKSRNAIKTKRKRPILCKLQHLMEANRSLRFISRISRKYLIESQ